MGADERQIRADLPKSAPGFDDPQPLIINVQIAREIGDIMGCKAAPVMPLLCVTDADYMN